MSSVTHGLDLLNGASRAEVSCSVWARGLSGNKQARLPGDGIWTSLPLAGPGMESGRWKQANLIWLELGLTCVSKPGCSRSPFPEPGPRCVLTQSAEGAVGLLMDASQRCPAWGDCPALSMASPQPSLQRLPVGTFSSGGTRGGRGEAAAAWFPKLNGSRV